MPTRAAHEGHDPKRLDSELATVPYSVIELSATAQRWADASIDALPPDGKLSSHPALTQLERWLESDDRLVDCVCDTSNWVHAAALGEIVKRARESFRGDDEDGTSVVAHVRSVGLAAVSGKGSYWGLEYPVRVAGPLPRSSGKRRILGFRFVHFEEAVQWDGLFQDRERYEKWLRDARLIVTAADIDALTQAELLAEWRRRS